MPVVVTGESPGKTDLLVNDILERIREENSVDEQEVKLPDEIDGKKITFHQSKEHNEFVFLLLALIAALVILFGYDRKLDQQIRKRNEEMMLDFSEIVSKLSLLYEAGSSISNAWAKIVEDHERKYPGKERFAYKEMKMVMIVYYNLKGKTWE